MSDNNRGSTPSIPEVRPSRDDGEGSSRGNNRHSTSRSPKRGHRRSSTNSSRRSSSHKSERSPTRAVGDHSPRRSGKGSSRKSSSTNNNSKTPESSKTQKLRLAPGSEGILPPPSLSSPTPSDKADSSGRSGRRTSRYNRYNKTPDSKKASSSSSGSNNNNKDRTSKLRMAGPGAVAAPPIPPDPFASATNGTGTITPGPSFVSSYASNSTATYSSNMTAPNVDQILMGQDPATRMAQDINNNNNSDQWAGTTPLEAVAAPNINEIEAARLQGREEGRNEKERERQQQQQQRDNIVFMAAPATNNDNTAKKYAFAAFCIVVIAAGIVVWQVMRSNNNSDGQVVAGPTPFTPPTQNECLATSQGLVLLAQKDLTVRTYAVEINFAIPPDMVNDELKLALLTAELEIQTRRYVLPLLIGCQIDGPIIIENNNFVIANAILETVTMDTPQTGCNLLNDSNSNSTLCSLAYMEMDLFLKDPEVTSDYVLELIAFVFQHQGLLKALDLKTPIETIDTQREYEVLAKPPASTSFPTPSPSIKPVPDVVPIPIDGSLPSKEDCLNIAAGNSVSGQQDLALQEYDIYLDVMLDIFKDDLTDVTRELEEKLQRLLMPALAGCDPSFFQANTVPGGGSGTAPGGSPVLGGTVVDNQNPGDSTAPGTAPGDNNSPSVLDSSSSSSNNNNQNRRRRLGTEGLVLNAVVEAEYLIRGLCLTESNPPCYRYVIHLDIFVRKIVASADFTEALMTKFREEPLVPRLGLLSPFVRITVVDGVAQTPSAMPSFSPSAYPTTLPPSQVPSALSSASPSANPSLNPTPRPTTKPTPRPTQTPPPTPGPTPFPTPRPTGRPTSRPTTSPPTRQPTRSPTRWPTPNPTGSPTKPCILSNADLSTAFYNWNDPTPSPSPTRPAVVAQYGPIGDWCFGPGVTSMAALFSYSFSFNEDISRWDVSGITDMSYMFHYAGAFNQNIGGWDVSSVTNMEYMFLGATTFNQNIGDWDVSKVTNMYHMFANAQAFNGNIGGWDVSSVTSVSNMFLGAIVFNQDLSNWDLSSVQFMEYMFYGASNFNRNLCAWGDHIQIGTNVMSSFESTSCPTTSPPDLSSTGPFCHAC